jgi:hypothetical protein
MNEDQRWTFISDLDDELLKGGVILSEWCLFIVREADIAFVASAYLATIVTGVAGIETYLRAEYSGNRQITLHELIEQSPISESLKSDIHALRKYRNRWVHVPNLQDDNDILLHPEQYEIELQGMAKDAIRTLRRTIYENQWI